MYNTQVFWPSPRSARLKIRTMESSDEKRPAMTHMVSVFEIFFSVEDFSGFSKVQLQIMSKFFPVFSCRVVNMAPRPPDVVEKTGLFRTRLVEADWHQSLPSQFVPYFKLTTLGEWYKDFLHVFLLTGLWCLKRIVMSVESLFMLLHLIWVRSENHDVYCICVYVYDIWTV